MIPRKCNSVRLLTLWEGMAYRLYQKGRRTERAVVVVTILAKAPVTGEVSNNFG